MRRKRAYSKIVDNRRTLMFTGFYSGVHFAKTKKTGKDLVLPTFIIIFAHVDESRSSSKCLGAMKFLLTSPTSAFVPRSLNEFDYEIKSYSKGKRGVA